MANRPSSTDPAPAAGDPNQEKTSDSTPGLGEQFGRTRSAVVGLVGAHARLAKAEFEEIAGAVKRAALLGGIALALLLVAGMLVSIGTILWLDEWIFGSLGWGAVHGGFLLIAVAVTLALFIIPGSARRIGLAVLVGLVVGAAVCLLVGGLLGAVTGARVPWNVAVAIGLALFLVVWPIVAAVLVLTHIDMKLLKARYVPEQTIETTKETIEWVREQLPLARKP